MLQQDKDMWAPLAQRYGRDYSWLAAALTMYEGHAAAAQGPGGRIACVSFTPQGHRDLGWQYGLQSGLRLHFLLEEEDPDATQTAAQSEAAQAAWQDLLPQPYTAADRLCLPVKTGRAALGWQLGCRLDAVRPLVGLRPFYLFVPAAALPLVQEVRRLPLADTLRLGRLLDNGWGGAGFCAAAQEVLLARRGA